MCVLMSVCHKDLENGDFKTAPKPSLAEKINLIFNF